MKPPSLPRPALTLALALLLGLLCGAPGPFDLLTIAEASSAREQRQIKKLRQQNRGLKRRVGNLRRWLADARRPVPPLAPAPARFLEMVTVGNAGNAPDQDFGGGAFGEVLYEFQIGKYEVTLEQYAVFLNAVAASDPHGLYNPAIASDEWVAGIERNGSDGGYSYVVIGSGDRPVTYVSWFDAARFCNWLHNGRPSGAQDATTTERGAYTLDGATSGVGFSRAWGARYWIPSEDEWYKAAYHQPADQGGDAVDYWFYPTRSNAVPAAEGPPGGSNSANYLVVTLGLTPAGAYVDSPSFYGTFDQGGNVAEWNDAESGGVYRVVRGGSWGDSTESPLGSYDRSFLFPYFESNYLGFRVAAF